MLIAVKYTILLYVIIFCRGSLGGIKENPNFQFSSSSSQGKDSQHRLKCVIRGWKDKKQRKFKATIILKLLKPYVKDSHKMHHFNKAIKGANFYQVSTERIHGEHDAVTNSQKDCHTDLIILMKEKITQSEITPSYFRYYTLTVIRVFFLFRMHSRCSLIFMNLLS